MTDLTAIWLPIFAAAFAGFGLLLRRAPQMDANFTAADAADLAQSALGGDDRRLRFAELAAAADLLLDAQ